MNCVIILGNGFDLDLGWKTSYEAFYNDQKGWNSFQTEEDDLFQFVIKKAPDNWFDFERTLYEYVQHRAKNPASKDIVQRDIQDYNYSFKIPLMRFLSQAAKGEIKKSSHAYRLLKSFVDSQRDSVRILSSTKLYSFNYTPLLNVIRQIDTEVKAKYTPVHGRIEDESIIFGFHDAPDVPREYRSLQKSMDANYKSSNIVTESLKADHIVFFGLSLGYIDGVYFKNLFDQLANRTNPQLINKHLFFITKNAQTMEDCKNNLLDMGINLQLLYNSNEVHFIYTDPKEAPKTEEIFSGLIKSISDN